MTRPDVSDDRKDKRFFFKKNQWTRKRRRKRKHGRQTKRECREQNTRMCEIERLSAWLTEWRCALNRGRRYNGADLFEVLHRLWNRWWQRQEQMILVKWNNTALCCFRYCYLESSVALTAEAARNKKKILYSEQWSGQDLKERFAFTIRFVFLVRSFATSQPPTHR